MKTYKYILLDWDGNLAKTLDIWLEACRTVVEKRGIHPTDEQIGASFGAFVTHMQSWGITDADEAMDEADSIAKQKLPHVALYPDALEVLEYLHNLDKKLALISSSSHENIDHLLEKHKLSDLFSAVVAGDDITHHKPHPEPLEKALALLGANKQDAIMIGDSDKDLGAANNTGIDSILFYPPEHKKFYDFEQLKSLSPTYVVSDFREIESIIN
jgi:pyrophosphatase PpaX